MKYKYFGLINLEWLKKYMHDNIRSMHEFIRFRDETIDSLKIEKNKLNLETIEKRKHVAKLKIAFENMKKICTEYNKKVELGDKLTEYINKDIDNKDSVFGDKKLVGVHLGKCTYLINKTMLNIGYKLEIKCFSRSQRGGITKDAYSCEWKDVAPEYYNMQKVTKKDKEKPDFPNIE